MQYRVLVLSILASSAFGCSLPTSVSATGDAGPGVPDMGMGRTDTGPPIDAWSSVDMGPRPDAWAPDMYVPGVDAYVPPVDAYVPPDMYVTPVDAYVPPDMYVAPVDAYVPPDMYVAPVDAYVPPVDAYTPPTCATSYPTVTNFCVDDGTYCGFIVNLMGGASCNSVCGASGCVHGYRPGPSGMRCAAGTDDGCATNSGFHICVCNR